MSLINPLLADTGTPPIPEVQSWARRYTGAHGPLIDLCQAVPSYSPPEALLRRLAKAAGSAAVAKYGPIAGDAALREAYAAHLSRFYGGSIEVDEVAITAGCNQAYFVAMLAVAQRGDTVLVPTPWYFNHSMTLQMLGIEARPVPCRSEKGFIPDLEEIEARIDERVRALVLVTPNNPTGAVYSAKTIARIYELCRRSGIWLVLDETYRDFLPRGQERPHDLLTTRGWPAQLIQLYSFSKGFAIPGHRLGALAGPTSLLVEAVKVMDCVQICAARAGQEALTWALGTQADWQAANISHERASRHRSDDVRICRGLDVGRRGGLLRLRASSFSGAIRLARRGTPRRRLWRRMPAGSGLRRQRRPFADRLCQPRRGWCGYPRATLSTGHPATTLP